MKTKKKVSTRLAQQVKSSAPESDLLDVIVELEHETSINSARSNSKSRSEQINERKASFARISSPVENVINEVGGKVLEKAWINNTLLAKLPAAGLKTVSELKEVEILDAPHSLESD